MTKTLYSQWVRFGHFVIWYSNLLALLNIYPDI